MTSPHKRLRYLLAMAATPTSSELNCRSRPSPTDIAFGPVITVTSVLTGLIAELTTLGDVSPDVLLEWLLLALPSLAVIWRRTATGPIRRTR